MKEKIENIIPDLTTEPIIGSALQQDAELEADVPKDTTLPWRDYSLTGRDSGPSFAPKHCYSTPIPRKRMKELMKRRDRPALIDYGLWLGLVLLTGVLVVLTWGTWWAVPSVILYGVFYGSCADSRWHECCHRTVFKTRWLNDAAYQLASFMSLKNPCLWRWSHTRHHTDTVIVGKDPEIAFPRPPHPLNILWNMLHLQAGWSEMKKMLRLSAGRLTKDQKTFLIDVERQKAFRASRAHLATLIATVGLCLILESWLPIVLIGGPTFFGSWLHHLLASLQHAGLAEDVPDHRLISRTVHMNRFFRFVYSTMNYNVEHHMYSMVPFYSLPALHEEIKADCPPAYTGTVAAFHEMIPAIFRQRRDPLYFVDRKPLLPEGANPSPDYTRPTALATE